jgi:hypothetical protein
MELLSSGKCREFALPAFLPSQISQAMCAGGIIGTERLAAFQELNNRRPPRTEHGRLRFLKGRASMASGLFLLFADLPETPIADQFPLLLVPKAKRQRF